MPRLTIRAIHYVHTDSIDRKAVLLKKLPFHLHVSYAYKIQKQTRLNHIELY